MSLEPSVKDMWQLVQSMRHQLAQDRTDIQRLWRALADIPKSVPLIVGGNDDDSGSSATGESGSSPPVEGSEPSYSPGGAPPASSAYASSGSSADYPYVWDGSGWYPYDDRPGYPPPPASSGSDIGDVSYVTPDVMTSMAGETSAEFCGVEGIPLTLSLNVAGSCANRFDGDYPLNYDASLNSWVGSSFMAAAPDDCGAIQTYRWIAYSTAFGWTIEIQELVAGPTWIKGPIEAEDTNPACNPLLASGVWGPNEFRCSCPGGTKTDETLTLTLTE